MIKMFMPEGNYTLFCKNCGQHYLKHPVQENGAVCPPTPNFNVVTEMFNQVAHRAYHHDDEVAQALVMVMKQMADAFGHEWLYDDVTQKWSLVQKG